MERVWLKNEQGIIRISTIIAVLKDMQNGKYAIRIDTNMPSSIYCLYDKEADRDAEFKVCCDILKEEEKKKSDKPKDYDKVKKSIDMIFARYGGRTTLSSTEIRNAMCDVEEIDWCGYGMPALYKDIAVKYGILERVSRQMFRLVDDND